MAATNPSNSNMISIANRILADTKRFIELAGGLPERTFALGSIDFEGTGEYVYVRNSLVANLDDLRYLAIGPKRSMLSFLRTQQGAIALQIAFTFDFFRIIPAKGEIHIADLAQKAGIDEDRACRMLRLLATYRIFVETKPRHFGHTPSSIVFHQDENIRMTGEYYTSELYEAFASAATCIKASPNTSDAKHCPFYTRHGMTFWEYYAQNPELSGRFAKAMAGWIELDGQFDIRRKYPWAKFQGTILDVGGGSGHVSMDLATEFPNLNFIVEDVPHMIAEGQHQLTTQPTRKWLEPRIQFLQHDFFQLQPVRDVAAVFLRWITHNWTDAQVISIFSSIVPTLESSAPGTPLLINDLVVPEPGEVPMHVERAVRNADIFMFTCLGAKQRSVAEFTELLKRADKRYNVVNVSMDANMGIIEACLEH
ncbi:O-methyltransferase [Hypoxylon trugodes]|uniref:O-methyltransferase n=1 Tax=Hypoxylon trugodes TaxID=326681 RepID=UPI00219C8D5E|nr:O-methyltransferase [Hypoxylon trugodes]KAI1388680.1 O-methyltransferase [Hypoxylon trugodes]